jgi:hypothetical protein
MRGQLPSDASVSLCVDYLHRPKDLRRRVRNYARQPR